MALKTMHKKVQALDDLEKILAKHRKEKKKVVLCHGVFDLMHPGHILYFQAAKKHGDILVVTITPDEFINKGPGRPVFNQRLRVESIAALECVDYVALNKWPTAVETLLRLKPNYYVKGQDYANAASDITGQIKNEMAAVKKVGGKTIFTNEEMFSSSQLLNKFFTSHPPQTNEYLTQFRSKYSADDIIKILRNFSDLRVLVVGEAILDQYCYCNPMAKSPKETIVASRFLSEENFAGGTVAIANHLANFCKSVSLVTVHGKEKPYINFFKSKLSKNVRMYGVQDGNRPTIVKRRYVEPNFLTKMYEIQYLDGSPISETAEKKALDILLHLFPKHDLVVVADYGHGFLTERLRNEITSLANFLCVNVQTNSANFGFNVLSKYHDVNYAAVDEPEMRLAVRSVDGEASQMGIQLRQMVKADKLMVSRGPRGSVVISKDDSLAITPALSTRIVDRTGVGDALFALTSLCAYRGTPPEVIGFIGSCVGAMAVEIVCNREPIDSVNLHKFITGILK